MKIYTIGIQHSPLSKLPPSQAAGALGTAPQFNVLCWTFDILSSQNYHITCKPSVNLPFYAKRTQFTEHPNKRKPSYRKQLQKFRGEWTPKNEPKTNPNEPNFRPILRVTNPISGETNPIRTQLCKTNPICQMPENNDSPVRSG